MGLSKSIKCKALELGFDLVGITGAGQIDHDQVERFSEWIEAGFCGQMDYMRRNCDKRMEPAKLMDGARSVICVGLNCRPPEDTQKSEETRAGRFGRVANFALYEDYHEFIKKRLRQLAGFITEQIDGEWRFKICVDSVPLAERAIAQRAGLGFIGKNHTLIHPGIGSQILLGEIVSDIELEADKPIAGECAGCEKCIRACPTGALRRDGRFDASRCISYLTIEHKDDIDDELAGKIGDRIFGCDECVKVCPYDLPCNSKERANKEFKFYPDRRRLDLEEISGWEDDDFEEFFADSIIKRTGLKRLKRNAKICLKNHLDYK